jgi:hypothetical protein
MAIYHLHASVGKRQTGQSAKAKAAYIQREGRYGRGRDDLAYRVSGHMPAWAEPQPTRYWEAADLYERANGKLFYHVEFALPVELTQPQQIDLARTFAEHLTRPPIDAAGTLPYTLAIHKGNGLNPHCHLLISERANDGLERDATRWFKRADPHHPERGGAAKTRTLQPTEWLLQARWLWEQQANQALALAGHPARIDRRTLEAQGIERDPTRHLGPATTGYERRTGAPSRRRVETDAERQAVAVDRDLQSAREAITTTERYLADLEQMREARDQARAQSQAEMQRQLQEWERQEQARQAPQARAKGQTPPPRPLTADETERQRLAHMTAAELAAEIQRLTPRPVEAVLRERFEVARADVRVKKLRQQVDAASQAAAAAHDEAASWREAHPVRARLHDAGLPHAYLAEQERIAHDESQRRQTLTPTLRAAEHQARQVADHVRPTIVAEQAPARIRLAELEQLRQRKAAQEQAQARQERELDEILSAFKVLTLNRQSRTHGYTDEGRVWKATPEALRRLVEDFNQRIPPAGRETALQFLREGLKREPAKLDRLRGLLDQQKERQQQQKRGRQH